MYSFPIIPYKKYVDSEERSNFCIPYISCIIKYLNVSVFLGRSRSLALLSRVCVGLNERGICQSGWASALVTHSVSWALYCAWENLLSLSLSLSFIPACSLSLSLSLMLFLINLRNKESMRISSNYKQLSFYIIFCDICDS